MRSYVKIDGYPGERVEGHVYVCTEADRHWDYLLAIEMYFLHKGRLSGIVRHLYGLTAIP